ncbi:MAG: MFS transporter [Clostridiales bacterium]|nr:MFS transporter [Clostridiales bacterium]
MKTFQVKLLYIYKFMSQCMPIYAFYTILFIQRGMSVTDIAVLLALWSLFTIVFEVPSGILADRWNRRNMLAIAALLQGLCFMIWFFSHSFLMFAFGFVFWAIACAFISGTEEGLTYDNLKSDGNEEIFVKVYGKARFCANMGTITGVVSGGIIASFANIESIALISAVICFVNVIVVLQIREKNYYSERVDDVSQEFFKTFQEAVIFLKGNRGALISILFLVLFVSLGEYMDEFDALIVNDFKLSNIWVSVILGVRFIFIALGDILAPIVKKRITSVKQIFLFNGLACIFLVMFTLFWHQYALFILGIGLMAMAISEILLVDALQNKINEEGRATVMSFYGMGQNVVMICFSLVFALLTGLFTLQQVYMIISVYGILGGISFFLCFRIMRN